MIMIEALGQSSNLLELAGAGTLGEVYRARDNRVGRTVAITVVTDQIASNPGLREEFLRRARAAAALSHPNIVTLYEVGDDDDDGGLYLIYEFVQGQTLKTIIAGRPLNPRCAVDLAGQIAEALADAHAADLVHGAITADTIIVTPKGHAKITDFGLAPISARATENAGASDRGPDDSDAYRADIFALGVILFETLTGRTPAPGAGVPSAVDRSLRGKSMRLWPGPSARAAVTSPRPTLAAELHAVRRHARRAAGYGEGSRPCCPVNAIVRDVDHRCADAGRRRGDGLVVSRGA